MADPSAHLRKIIERLALFTANIQGGTNQECFDAIQSLSLLPKLAALEWHGRRIGDPWPDNAPWTADSAWAQLALLQEWHSLAFACDFVMARFLYKGDPRPYAEWVSAGWAPGPSALQVLAGYLDPTYGPIEVDAHGKPNREGKRVDFRKKPGRPQTPEIVLRDIRISKDIEARIAAGSKYEYAFKDAAEAFSVDPHTAKRAYDKRHRNK